jgi:hypothetical protein
MSDVVKFSELRWYRGTPVVLSMDEACFCFGIEREIHLMETNDTDDL